LRQAYVKGGLSRVHKAYDREKDCFVAVKFIDQTGDALLIKSMWEHEWRALKRFRTSYIASLVKSGNARCHGALYIATEWLADNLQSRLDRGLRPDSSLPHWLSLASGLTEGISKSHEQGVFHRDLKPANIMFRSDKDDDWRPVLIDFGAANLPESSAGETVAGFHTPLYSPPAFQLLDGNARDIFAVAAVLSVALMKKQPNNGQELLDRFAELGEASLIAGNIHRTLAKGLRPSSKSFFSSIKLFKDELLEAQRANYKEKRKHEQLTFFLTQTARDSISRINDDADLVGSQFLEVNFSGEFWLRFDPDSLHSGQLQDFRLYAAQLELLCSVDQNGGPETPFAIKSVRHDGDVKFDR
jgi:serine/threonine protein kinase